MIVHDWRKVDSGDWHDFHQAWLAELRFMLNRGILPKSYYAQTDQRTVNYEPDILTLQRRDEIPALRDNGNIAVLERPKTRRFFESR